jgi:hyperosmotically inducible protein
MKTNSLRVAVIAALAALSLAACDRNDGRTVGQKLDSAVDKTQQKLDAAGDKIADASNQVVASTKDAMRDAKADVKAGANDVRTSDTARAMSDTAITASIRTDLVKDPDLSALKIDVDTRDGVVTLNGLTDNEAARQRAEKMASAVKGVKEVRNFLVVKRA